MREEYYEGILQIRNPKDEIVDYVYEDISHQDNTKAKITKIVEHKSSWDIYFSSQKYTQAIAKKLHNVFGGTISISSRVHTRDTKKNKDLKRIAVLYTVPDYCVNEVVEINSKAIKITGIHRMVTGVDLETGKKVAYEYKNIHPEVIKLFHSTVSRVYPSLQILDPETYQPINVTNKKSLKIGQKIKFVKLGNKTLLV